MADGWARTPSSIVRELPWLPVASAPRRARASQPGAQQQSQRRCSSSEPRSTHRRAPRRLRSAQSSVASCQLLPPLPRRAPTPRPGWTPGSPPRAPRSSGSAPKASHARAQRESQQRRTASRGASSPSGDRELDRPQRNFSASGGRRGAKSRRGRAGRRGAEAGERSPIGPPGARDHVTITRLQPLGPASRRK